MILPIDLFRLNSKKLNLNKAVNESPLIVVTNGVTIEEKGGPKRQLGDLRMQWQPHSLGCSVVLVLDQSQ